MLKKCHNVTLKLDTGTWPEIDENSSVTLIADGILFCGEVSSSYQIDYSTSSFPASGKLHILDKEAGKEMQCDVKLPLESGIYTLSISDLMLEG